MALPCGTTGSLCPSFLPDRPVGLPVKRPSAITLCGRLPIGLRAPWEASVTLLEATTPVKLPAKQCPQLMRVSDQTGPGPYFNGGSRIRAGRNLPDKEFRYLRTVIVTAAVYRGFNSGLPLR